MRRSILLSYHYTRETYAKEFSCHTNMSLGGTSKDLTDENVFRLCYLSRNMGDECFDMLQRRLRKVDPGKDLDRADPVSNYIKSISEHSVTHGSERYIPVDLAALRAGLEGKVVLVDYLIRFAEISQAKPVNMIILSALFGSLMRGDKIDYERFLEDEDLMKEAAEFTGKGIPNESVYVKLATSGYLPVALFIANRFGFPKDILLEYAVEYGDIAFVKYLLEKEHVTDSRLVKKFADRAKDLDYIDIFKYMRRKSNVI